jgi:hypothetical protein
MSAGDALAKYLGDCDNVTLMGLTASSGVNQNNGGHIHVTKHICVNYPVNLSLSEGHVYIVVGQCSDGSVVLLHSSPPGVMITGTTTRSGDKNSEAIRLAKQYMKKYYPAFNSKFPDTSRSASYLTNYAQMRWFVGKTTSLMSDPEGYRYKNAQQVLQDLFGG